MLSCSTHAFIGFQAIPNGFVVFTERIGLRLFRTKSNLVAHTAQTNLKPTAGHYLI